MRASIFDRQVATPAGLEIVRLLERLAARTYVVWGGQNGGQQLQWLGYQARHHRGSPYA